MCPVQPVTYVSGRRPKIRVQKPRELKYPSLALPGPLAAGGDRQLLPLNLFIEISLGLMVREPTGASRHVYEVDTMNRASRGEDPVGELSRML